MFSCGVKLVREERTLFRTAFVRSRAASRPRVTGRFRDGCGCCELEILVQVQHRDGVHWRGYRVAYCVELLQHKTSRVGMKLALKQRSKVQHCRCLEAGRNVGMPACIRDSLVIASFLRVEGQWMLCAISPRHSFL